MSLFHKKTIQHQTEILSRKITHLCSCNVTVKRASACDILLAECDTVLIRQQQLAVIKLSNCQHVAHYLQHEWNPDKDYTSQFTAK